MFLYGTILLFFIFLLVLDFLFFLPLPIRFWKSLSNHGNTKRKDSTCCNAQLCEMSFSYDEEEGETSSFWCKSLNFFIASSTFKSANNKLEEAQKIQIFLSTTDKYYSDRIQLSCQRTCMNQNTY